MNMFCYQCEQTAKGSGCTAHGVCGKSPDVAEMQDLLMYALKDVSRYAEQAAVLGKSERQIDRFLAEGLFATITNVNFDAKDLQKQVKKAAAMRSEAKELYEAAAKEAGKTPEAFETPLEWWTETDDLDQMIRNGEQVGIQERIDRLGEDVTGLQELMTYGLKGIGAYAYHADILGKKSGEVDEFIREGLSYLTGASKNIDELVGMNLKCGEANLRVMELLDAAHTENYGHPEPTKVRVTPVKGKCIAVSGHDLKDLEEILKQTEGTDINVYTHGEMLMCNSYPGLKQYPHFKGNYGGAWQDQRQDFDAFPGAILMTTNCIQKPKGSYEDRIFTSGPTAWPGLTHVHHSDFSPVIEAAQKAPGFAEDHPEAYTITGFARNAVMAVADQVVEAVKNGRIRHDDPVGTDPGQPGQIIPEDSLLVVAGKDVAGDVDVHAPVAAQGHRRFHLVQAEIAGKVAQTEILAGQVDGIGPEMHGGLQFFKVARRRQQFDSWEGSLHVSRYRPVKMRLYRTIRAGMQPLDFRTPRRIVGTTFKKSLTGCG